MTMTAVPESDEDMVMLTIDNPPINRLHRSVRGAIILGEGQALRVPDIDAPTPLLVDLAGQRQPLSGYRNARPLGRAQPVAEPVG